MSSVKKNIVLNGINTATSILFPLVTFPYAARTLLPEGIGIVNFQNGIINYIILMTSLGIPLYAIKEVARLQDRKEERDRATVEILTLSFVLCLIGYVAVWALAEFIPQIHQSQKLFYILSLSIVFTTIGVDWFYRGIEDFEFITIRAIAVRCLAASALFIFVKTPADIIPYGLITVGSTVGNNFINFFHLRTHIDLSKLKLTLHGVLRHVKPSFHVFVLNLIISLYIQLNSVMLGFLSSDTEVGYFSAGTKLMQVTLSIIGSISAVLLPRCSSLLAKNDTEKFAQLIHKSLCLITLLSLPLIAGLWILAPQIIKVFCGSEFTASIPVLIWSAPIILLISLTNMMGLQILYPKNKINLVIISVSFGAVINIVFNLLLIPQHGATGAAISSFLAEGTVLIAQMALGRKYYPFKLRTLFMPKYILATLIMSAAVWPLSCSTANPLLSILATAGAGMMIYAAVLYFQHDELLLEIKRFIKK